MPNVGQIFYLVSPWRYLEKTIIKVILCMLLHLYIRIKTEGPVNIFEINIDFVPQMSIIEFMD
ncbi:hypothetical protein DAA48_16685 [Aeromonas veronii]|uniref:Uncharacterized protein n=1 Tax=Aeromonas veronii TaxID=654 RepID=A0A2T4MZ86_AERVE|nr:hypothetical protein DAA48_16685 [Aeromonas veronii]